MLDLLPGTLVISLWEQIHHFLLSLQSPSLMILFGIYAIYFVLLWSLGLFWVETLYIFFSLSLSLQGLVHNGDVGLTSGKKYKIYHFIVIYLFVCNISEPFSDRGVLDNVDQKVNACTTVTPLQMLITPACESLRNFFLDSL